jgi:hypothetical protein
MVVYVSLSKAMGFFGFTLSSTQTIFVPQVWLLLATAGYDMIVMSQ